MAAEHAVTCPKCSHSFQTKANQRTLISCVDCGEKFRVPAVEKKPAAAVEPAGEPVKGSGIKIVRDTGRSTKITRNARPKKPTTKSEPPAAKVDAGGVVSADQASKTKKPAAPANQEQAKVFGRRGGLGYYDRIRGRG